MDKSFWIRLAADNPNGISFEPLSLRLWHARAGVSMEEAKGLLAPKMLQLGNLWYCKEMLASDEAWSELCNRIDEMLEQRGFFACAILGPLIASQFPKIRTTRDVTGLLTFLNYELADFRNQKFCIADSYTEAVAKYLTESELELAPNQRLARILEEFAAQLTEILQDKGGMLRLDELRQHVLAHMDDSALEAVRAEFLPHVYSQADGAGTVWQLPDTFGLPEDFSDKVTYLVNLFSRLGRSLGATTLANGLDVLYDQDFRKDYDLQDDAIFLDQCRAAYSGDGDLRVDFRYKKLTFKTSQGSGGRARSKDTKFADLGLSPGTVLYYGRDPSVTCEVVDRESKVRYAGEELYISTLASRLRNTPATNGFREFCYEGESLADRRARMQVEGSYRKASAAYVQVTPALHADTLTGLREDSIDDNLARDSSGQLILGLQEKPISKSFWERCQRASRIPGIEGWLYRISQGQSHEEVAKTTKYSQTTFNYLILLYKVYLKANNRL